MNITEISQPEFWFGDQVEIIEDDEDDEKKGDEDDEKKGDRKLALIVGLHANGDLSVRYQSNQELEQVSRNDVKMVVALPRKPLFISPNQPREPRFG